MLKNNFLFICLVFVSMQLSAQHQTIDKVIAVVGDRPILLSQVESEIIQAKQQGVDLGENARGIILDQLLYENLLIHYAILDSLEVTDQQVNNKMEGNLKYFENQIGGREKLEEFYGKSVEQIKEDFFPQIKDKLLSQAMESKITERLKVTPAEVRSFFNKIPADSLPFINSYIEYAQITTVPKISDVEKKRAREKLEQIRKDVVSGASTFCFEASGSDDPGSAGRCGEYDFVRRGQFVPEFDAVAFSLKDGEYSEIFETAYGFHFMQLIQRRGEEYKVRHILKSPKVSALDLQKASQRLDSIYTAVVKGSISFSDAAKQFSDDADTKQNGGKVINMQTGDTHFDISEMDPQLFILVDKMKPGDVSKPANYMTQDSKQGFRIIKLLNRSNPHRANLSDDYQLIQNAAQNEKERTTIDKWVNDKIPTTYIWLDEEFRTLLYRYNWVKSSN